MICWLTNVLFWWVRHVVATVIAKIRVRWRGHDFHRMVRTIMQNCGCETGLKVIKLRIYEYEEDQPAFTERIKGWVFFISQFRPLFELFLATFASISFKVVLCSMIYEDDHDQKGQFWSKHLHTVNAVKNMHVRTQAHAHAQTQRRPKKERLGL